MKLCVSILLLGATFALAGLGPNLTIAREVQLEPQVVGNSVKTTIPFTNSGQQVLNITKIETPCGCTLAAADRQQLKPGETGNIEVTIDTQRLTANYDKTLRVLSNDSAAPELPVRIRFDLLKTASP